MAMVASSSGNRVPPRSRNQQVKAAASIPSSDRDQSSDNRNSNSDDHSNANANTNSNSNSPPTTAPSFASNSGSALPSRTISQLRVAAIAHVQQQCTLTCYIPPSRVGAVIGRRGATIVHIQREAAKKSWGHGGQVRVSVVSPGNSNSTSSNTGPGAASDGAEDGTAAASAMGADPSQQAPAAALWTPVIIRGDPCGAIAAAKLLLPLLSSGPPPVSVGNNGNNNPAGSSDDNGNAGGDHGTESTSAGPVSTTHDSSDMDDVVMEIPIHRSRHAAIIGKKGLTIAALSADHNVRIMVPHRNQQQHQQQQQPPPQQDANTSVKSPPSNINIVQLEGELENVERCLAKMLMVVCGSLSSSSSSNNITNTNSNPSSSTERGTESSNHSNTKIQPAESVVAEYETQTSQPTTTTSAGQDKDSISNNPNIAVSTDTNDNNNGSNIASKRSVVTTANTSYNSKKESKFSEQVITVPPQLYHLVPSLGRIRQIGKSTNTNIRRKKLEGTKAGQSANEDTEESGNNNSTPTTQLFVSGKTDFVKNAVSHLERMLTPSLSSGDASSFNNINPKHKEQQQQEQEDQLQRSGDDSKIVASGANNSNANESTVGSTTNIAASKNAKIRDSTNNNSVDQQGIAQQQPASEKKGASSNSKRRNHSGRGGGGGRMGKKRGGRGGRGDGGGATNSAPNTNLNAKE